MAHDFFHSPLPETDRRRFLSECTRNVERTYVAPSLNNVPVATQTKSVDTQFIDVQYRLSGITCPINYFVHRVLLDGSVTADAAIEFANVIHALLADTASHIIQVRVENIFLATRIRGSAPHMAPATQEPLLDPKALVEHVHLSKAVQATSMHSQNLQPRKGKANSPRTNSHNSAQHEHDYDERNTRH
ncbi:hypothetical protein BDB00DRAFT_777800 [Zychaea mexicana]|uniref:uncharacterized protein n=1 Tax=Zychaea mexicana TaxID=64656 RepID=UPI0022FE42B0|nr:uncharacterized protein BDB00DRAFT_777800 [Zychaea mexicana]KAI9466495.1 hypothetical protein BDB00DRAFT_777800 [Zychaea mexicana]